ncbi:MAG: hypothetical protein PUD58_05520 [Prevotella sp.]|uniref:hypothetical protein n=1 Tax=Prevotella sp. TaxID=59823 RepID=UPI00258A6AAF|nr:hypothetical protein [Prevotella sp.]MDD6853751.1 hypothetical protein [Prevotella sp.]
MKIILITTITPASENIRGTSSLPYHHDGKEDVGNVDLEGVEYPIGLCLKDDLYMMLNNKISTYGR